MEFFARPPRERLHQLTTHWTEIESLATAHGEDRNARWDRLLARYERPICDYLADVFRNTGGGRVDAGEVKDIAQEFFLGVIHGGWLEIDRERIDSFRAYLQTILRRRVLDALRHRMAAKRHPRDASVISLDVDAEISLPSTTAEEPQSEVLRLWARGIALRAVEMMRERAPARGSAAAEILVSLGLPAQHLVNAGSPSTAPTRSRARRDLESYVTAALLEGLGEAGDLEQEWDLFRQHIG